MSSYAETDMDLSFEDFQSFVEKRRFHIDSEYVIPRMAHALSRAQSLEPINPFERLKQSIATSIPAGKHVAVLCGGGVDSNFLLALLCENFSNVSIISAETTNNSRDLESTAKLNMKLGRKWVRNRYSRERLALEASLFFEKHARIPNDQATPLVQCMLKEAQNLGADIVVDGQYADTVLFANPQNTLFSKIGKIPGFFAPSYLGSTKEPASKLKLLSALLFVNPALKMMILSRLHFNSEIYDFLTELSKFKSNDANLIFQLLFWFGLLKTRERDKYKLAEKNFVFSPFDDIDILLSASKNQRYGKKNKSFMRSYLISEFELDPADFISRSFEAS